MIRSFTIIKSNISRILVIFTVFIFNWNLVSAQITLSHNVGNTPIATDMFSCNTSQSWSRIFLLSDFGISNNDTFVISSGNIGIYNSIQGIELQFRIYKVDSNFPNSYSITDLIGSSQVFTVPAVDDNPEIINVDFATPITIPSGIEKIMVEVRSFYSSSNPELPNLYIAGTQQDNDDSWYWGCHVAYFPSKTEELETPVYNANFLINVTGEVIETGYSDMQTVLTHNPCEIVIDVNQYSCSWGGLKYARVFELDDFGVSNNEEFIIDRGEVALSSVGVWDAKIQFNIYSVDENFPSSYSSNDLIGSSQIIYIPYFGSGNGVNPRVFEVLFGEPIVVPENVDRVLVEVYNLPSNSSSGLVFIAGGGQNNAESWLRSEAGGCTPFQEYIPVYDPINYYINVTGRTNHINNNLELNISNICSEFLKEFSVENASNIAGVQWDFGDPASGAENVSNDLSPYHDFSEDGTYTITATVTSNGGNVEVLTETIDVVEPPNAYGIDNIVVCEDDFGTGISSQIDVAGITEQILGNQTDKLVTYTDGSFNEYDELPNPFTNTVSGQETILVRVAHEDNPCCFSEISFDIVVNSIPETIALDDLSSCENSNVGYASFDLNPSISTITNNSQNLTIEIHDSSNNMIATDQYSEYNNIVPNSDFITFILTDNETLCQSEIQQNLFVGESPVAYSLNTLYGCDDNGDGISEYFDTSLVQEQVLNGQTGVIVTYYDNNNVLSPSPLPNPFTNTMANSQDIVVRVSDAITGCYSETTLNLQTTGQPVISDPQPLFACDMGNGFSQFDTSMVQEEVIGAQTGLIVSYFDTEGNELPSPLPETFESTEAFTQTINIMVEDELNPNCYSETSLQLNVNPLPEVDLEPEYFICNLEPSILLGVNSGFNSYQWYYEDDILISSSSTAEIETAGDYTLIISKISNGIECHNSYPFRLIRSSLPEIVNVNYGELGDNFIEIIASGDGDFEYSIDNINYQDSNYFSNVKGGSYEVYVRDKDGCGEDSNQITIVDYPKFFTPNSDGANDVWQIFGINEFPQATITIFDRYGKILKELSSYDYGWDGLYNGSQMPSSDYWFTANLNEEIIFTGHFTLKR